MDFFLSTFFKNTKNTDFLATKKLSVFISSLSKAHHSIQYDRMLSASAGSKLSASATNMLSAIVLIYNLEEYS